MSDPPDNDTSGPSAKPEGRPSRSVEASRRLSQLLSRPLGTPPAPGEAPLELPERPAAPSAVVPPASDATNEPVSPPPVVAPALESEPVAPKELPAAQREPVDEPAPLAEPAESVAAEPPLEIPAPPAAAAERVPPPAPTPPPPISPALLASLPQVPPAPIRASPPPAEEDQPSDAAAEGYLGKIRRLMLIANLFMFIAVAAVIGVIGFRVFHSGDTTAPAKAPPSAAPAEPALETTLTLPRNARVVQTGVADERLVITIEVGGKLEVRTFDVKTLKPAGRMTFTTVP